MKNKPLVRVVFDCMIYLQGIARQTGPANACFAVVREGIAELYLSLETLAEIQDVLNRTIFRRRFPSLTEEMINEFLREVEDLSVLVENVPSAFIYSRDPKDEKYINLAIEAKADYIVSRDNDLLDLMTGYTGECKDFRRRFRKLKVIPPSEFLAIVEKRIPS